jgi:tRNA threonylcarbamoyl adenosine modification protein YjeE
MSAQASRLLCRKQIHTAEAMHEFGLRLGAMLKPGDLVVLTGPLGAGKTTMTRGVGEALGCIGTVSSPTFVIARTHKRENSEAPLVHVDVDFANSVTLIEWGRGFTDGIAESWLDLEIERDHSGETETRELTLIGHGERWADFDGSAL